MPVVVTGDSTATHGQLHIAVSLRPVSWTLSVPRVTAMQPIPARFMGFEVELLCILNGAVKHSGSSTGRSARGGEHHSANNIMYDRP